LLNSLQYKRRCSLLEPVIGFVQAQKTFFEMGNETLSRKDFDDFIANISASVQRFVGYYRCFFLLRISRFCPFVNAVFWYFVTHVKSFLIHLYAEERARRF